MIATLLAVAAATPLPAPTPVAGMWRTPRGAVIRIDMCGAALCGTIVSVEPIPGNPQALDTRNRDTARRGRPLKGLAVLTGLTGGPTAWRGGHVYNPEDGGTYSASVDVADPRTLRVKGCIAAFLCRTQTWVRIP